MAADCAICRLRSAAWQSAQCFVLNAVDVNHYLGRRSGRAEIMTLYMTFEALKDGTLLINQKLPVSRVAQGRSPSKLGLRRGEKMWERAVSSAVRMKRLDRLEIDNYLHTGDWDGKAGGYSIQGPAGAFIPWIEGSYSAIVGLPVAAQEANAEMNARLVSAELTEIPQDADLNGFAVSAGAAVFRTYCAQCHGAGAGGVHSIQHSV